MGRVILFWKRCLPIKEGLKVILRNIFHEEFEIFFSVQQKAGEERLN
jgi:hypothetical protein